MTISDYKARARELLLQTCGGDDDGHAGCIKSAHTNCACVADIAAALAAAELRGRIEGLKEAQALSPIDDDAAMFTVHRERERLHNAIDARLASLQPEVAKREEGE